jgi:uncharacterized protein YqgC (DUF456 family)
VLLIVALATIAATAFTVVPVVPGTLFLPLGAVLAGLVAGFDDLRWWFWAAQAVLVAVYLVVDNVAQALGVRRLGGSRQAIIGGAIGVFVGPFLLTLVMGPFALLLGPPIGAVAGTLIGERRARRALPEPAADAASYRRLGIGAFTAFVIGTVAKLSIVAVQAAMLVAVVR